MFLIDDITLFPVKSILSLFREIYQAAVKEMADEAAFDAREQQILDRLDAIEARDAGDDHDESEGEESEDEADFVAFCNACEMSPCTFHSIGRRQEEL